MKKILYHGSQYLIEKPIFGYGKKYNDYGVGFYCTENVHMAKEWGVSEKKDGYANCYELDMDNLTVLNLTDDSFIILNWLAVLLVNRQFDATSGLAVEAKQYIIDNFMIDYESYDLIKGYRADDSYFSFAQDFLNGTISYRQLGNAMKLGKLGEQITLKSKKAFEHLKFVGAEVAYGEEWYLKKMNRDRKARREYFDLERNKRQKGDIYITGILDEEMKNDDLRLR